MSKGLRISSRPRKLDIYEPMKHHDADADPVIKHLLSSFVEKDGVSLNSMAMPDGLLEKTVAAIKDGRLWPPHKK